LNNLHPINPPKEMSTLKVFRLTSRTTAAMILGLFTATTVFACVVALLIVVDLRSGVNQFCQTTDAVYQTIIANSEDWLKLFSASSGVITYPQFSVTGSSQNYGVVPDESDEIEFYVATRPGWPNTPEGSRGYLFVVAGKSPSNDWIEEYKVSHLDGNVFCYTR
jgi:hypothetical protein